MPDSRASGLAPKESGQFAEPLLEKENGDSSTLGFERRKSALEQDTDDLPDIVQFAAEIFYAKENEGCVRLEVMRAGPSKGYCEVTYMTEDSSATDGDQYEAVSGVLKFGPDELLKTFDVKLIEDDRYNPTKEFKVSLDRPAGCELGMYLKRCRVKILDDDVFPSNAFEGFTSEETIDKVHNFALMKAFVYLCYTVPGVRWRSLVTLLIDQYGNLFYLLRTWLLIYMMDTVFALDKKETEDSLLIPGQRGYTVIACALLWLVPFVVQHFMDIMKVKLDVSAMLRGWLQGGLFNKYLTYNDETRAKVDPAAVSLAVLEQVNHVVSKGYMRFWKLLALLGKLIIVLFFMLKESPSAIWAVCLFPILMGIFIMFRGPTLEKIGEQIEDKEKKLMYSVQEACANYTLIADYHQRPKAHDCFEECVEDYNEAKMPMELAELNNGYVPGWISTVAVAFYILLQGPVVLDRRLKLGVFIAMIKILNELGDEFKEAYEIFMEMLEAVGPLKRLTIYLNGETDFDTVKDASAKLMKETLDMTKKLAHSEHLHNYALGASCNLDSESVVFVG
jgi:hypothetical protein